MPEQLLSYTAPDGTFYLAGGDDANCTIAACPVELSVYGYRPSLPISSLLIALYGLVIIVQLIMGLRYKSWWYMGSMIAGCVSEIIGYAGRIMLYQNPWGHDGFIIQIVLITIGPVFFSAALYVLLSVVISHIGQQYSRLSPKIFYYVFISCDVISLILQAVGGAMSSISSGSSTTGVNIALAGLVFQVATLVAFSLATIDYGIRSRGACGVVDAQRRFNIFAIACATATILILIRCCYRVYELNEGYQRSSEALRDQPMFIGLESFMVVIAAYAMLLAHPGTAMQSKSFLATNDEEKVKAEANSSSVSD